MITLSDFQKLDALNTEIKNFLFEKCKEYSDAKEWLVKCEYFAEDFDWFEFDGLYLKVYFEESGSNQYSFSLPLDIVFEPNFKELMEIRVAEEREQERLSLLERRRIKEAEAEKEQMIKQKQEIEALKTLMKKYPDVVKCELGEK